MMNTYVTSGTELAPPPGGHCMGRNLVRCATLGRNEHSKAVVPKLAVSPRGPLVRGQP